MGSGAWNNFLLPHTSGEEPESGSAVWQLAMKLWYIRSDGMLSSVICHLCPEQDGLWSVLLDGQGSSGPHFTTETSRSYKPTHMKGPKQLWPPNLTLLHRFPCIFVSVPSHIWCHLHHPLVWLWLELPRATPAIIPLVFPQKQLWFFFYSDRLIWWFCQDETSSGWPGWLPGLGAQRSGDSAVPDTTFAMVAVPSDSMSPSAYESCSLGFAAAWQGEDLFLQGGVTSGAQGAP